ncbi:MAG TPA: hypothetical protein ENJ50_09435 [Planctomycetaceae bacterium]|nr:hypothetical protein [Planctomycetaceae bacterium]
MQTDPGLQPTRDIRVRISRNHGNDPRRLVEYYIEFQRRFAERLRPPPKREEAPEQAAAADRPSPDR